MPNVGVSSLHIALMCHCEVLGLGLHSENSKTFTLYMVT